MCDLEAYLDEICRPLGSRSDEVRRELRQHIEQAAAVLEAAGWPREDAVYAAIREFGDPTRIASQLASVHGRGGMQMLRRVMQPMLLAVGVWVGSLLIRGVWWVADGRAASRRRESAPRFPGDNAAVSASATTRLRPGEVTFSEQALPATLPS